MKFEIRKGTAGDAETLIRFLRDVKEGMTQKEWFYLDPPELVRRQMSDGSLELWLAMDGDRVAGIFNILHPELDPCNYGYDLDLTEEELRCVVHMDNVAVHSDYRGNGLQRKLVQIAEQSLTGKGKKILLTTVHPENSYSLNNMKSQGYVVQKLLDKFGSRRYILRKEIF